jgi:hypothetical protein
MKSNALAIAGFVLAIIALFTGGIPVLGWIVWLLGLVFSAVGLSRAKILGGRGFAIAGLIISLLGIILIILFTIGLLAFLAF